MKLLPTINPKCPICHSPAKKMGFRKCKQRTTQRYLCKSCNRSFISQPSLQKSKTYNLQTILNTISNYNLGQPLRKITNQNKEPIPSSTIHNWTKTINLPMNRLRNQLKTTPKHGIIKKQRFIHHKQPFLYQYHNLKLNFAKKFPTLINYLETIPTTLPKQIFSNSKRISGTAKETPTKGGDEPGVATEAKPSVVPENRSFLSTAVGVARRISNEVKNPSPAIGLVGVSKDIKLPEKQNYAVQLAKLASTITNDNKKRHQIIEDFMLINDTATIATEIPIYLTKEESNQITKLNQNLTGHIDILQIRYHKIYILDFKPEPVNTEQTKNQLLLYQQALSKRTSIPIHKFRLAFFNDKTYQEIN